MQFIDVTNSKKTTHTINTPGVYIYYFMNYSGKLHFEIQTKDSKVYLFGLFIGTNNNEFHIETVQHHKSGDTISDLLIKGVFFDTSKFIFDGLIKINKGSNGANAYQKNQNIVLSKGVYVESRPKLEILSDDVRCTHGSTTGRLSDEQTLFLKMRGINKRNAEKLLIEGFIYDLFDTITKLGAIAESNKAKKYAMKMLLTYYDENIAV